VGFFVSTTSVEFWPKAATIDQNNPGQLRDPLIIVLEIGQSVSYCSSMAKKPASKSPDQNRTVSSEPSNVSPILSAEGKEEADLRAHREAERTTPSNEQLRLLLGKYQPALDLYGDDEAMPY